MNNFKKINGITISNLTNAETFFYNKVNYGVYNYYYNQYIYRFEKKILLTSKNSRIIFFKFFFKLLPLSLNFKIIKNYILYFQNCLFLIKSWRQYKNLPSKGQRTWSNGWTASKAYNIIKELKFKNTTRYFKNIEVAQRSLAFTCEVENLIWLKYWLNEWRLARIKHDLFFLTKTKNLKVDLSLLSRGVVGNFSILGKNFAQPKKHKKHGNATIGFSRGFTKLIFSITKTSIKAVTTNKKKFNKKAAKKKVILNFILNHAPAYLLFFKIYNRLLFIVFYNYINFFLKKKQKITSINTFKKKNIFKFFQFKKKKKIKCIFYLKQRPQHLKQSLFLNLKIKKNHFLKISNLKLLKKLNLNLKHRYNKSFFIISTLAHLDLFCWINNIIFIKTSTKKYFFYLKFFLYQNRRSVCYHRTLAYSSLKKKYKNIFLNFKSKTMKIICKKSQKNQKNIFKKSKKYFLNFKHKFSYNFKILRRILLPHSLKNMYEWRNVAATKYFFKIKKLKLLQYVTLNLKISILLEFFKLPPIFLNFFTDNRLLFLNGKVCSNLQHKLKKNDCVQFLISKSLLKFLLHNKIVMKKYLMLQKIKTKKTSIYKIFTNKSTAQYFYRKKLPSWIEFDVFTMSFIILNKPTLKKNSLFFYNNLNFFFYKLMTWTK